MGPMIEPLITTVGQARDRLEGQTPPVGEDDSRKAATCGGASALVLACQWLAN
jgi:hypothetical protein